MFYLEPGPLNNAQRNIVYLSTANPALMHIVAGESSASHSVLDAFLAPASSLFPRGGGQSLSKHQSRPGSYDWEASFNNPHELLNNQAKGHITDPFAPFLVDRSSKAKRPEQVDPHPPHGASNQRSLHFHTARDGRLRPDRHRGLSYGADSAREGCPLNGSARLLQIHLPCKPLFCHF
jgi:hypothetical protein